MGLPNGPETDNFPFIKARWFKDVVNQKREVRVIVIHTMEAREKDNTAEIIAKDFQDRPASNKGSAHLCIDNNSIVQCVLDNDVAFAAPGANHNGIQLELAGFARQTRDDWFDEYSKAVLENAANAAAQYCLKYDLPRKHLTNSELRDGSEGIIGHVQATEVFNLSDHTDPGNGFPWSHFIDRVEHYYAERKAKLGL
jgi:N-acetyl-anhydromuramyl-L-alanine amidase AmpD